MCENGEVTCRKTGEPTVTGFTPALLDSPLDGAVGLTGKISVHFVLLPHCCHVVHAEGDLRRPHKGATVLMSEKIANGTSSSSSPLCQQQATNNIKITPDLTGELLPLMTTCEGQIWRLNINVHLNLTIFLSFLSDLQ